MSKSLTSLWCLAVLGFVLGTAFPARAQPAQCGPNMASNTVCGRLGAGLAGPPQAIPFATLQAQLQALYSVAGVAHEWIASITGGVANLTQPASTDLSDSANLARLNAVGSFTAAQRGTPVNVTISTATFTPNFNTGQNFEIDLVHASCPCTLANPSTTLVAGQSGMIEIHQSSTGSDTIGTWGSDYQYVGGTASITLSTSANAVDYLPYYVNNAATGIVFGGLLLKPVH